MSPQRRQRHKNPQNRQRAFNQPLLASHSEPARAASPSS
ncbi:hypothetical protein XOC_3332 [Xanthomonas oryzae pv. oryzicola BLS256]|uniref:Uncharacterized protein n=1 Tax=Xanthomonas oryzae pv. oryzicola (strain BLS256) TaxID=383407 RepID=G7TC18_XANOB|nr:hypothetical protein XOC_3332 [Xanthomonas oryzae pv. oryzicola BLS256]QEO96440.1 hypothetical protein XOCgx_1447 [Xanthomonas oryzae pv. oryzicola]